jgi:PAS domain S-box-containing protein
MDDHAVVMVDASGVIRFWNPGAARVFGHPAGEAVGRTLDLIVPDEFRQAHWSGFRRAMASGEAAAEGRAGPFPALCADGEVRPIEGRLALLRSPPGQVIGAMVVFGSASL